jgi:MSHA biogenesis protein MshI
MSRQINLFNPALLPPRVVFPAGQALLVSVLGIVAFFAIGFTLKDIASAQVQRVQQQSTERQSLKQRIAQLENERSKRRPDPQLIVAVDRLKEQQNHQQRSLSLLQMAQHEPGFTEKLKALARQRQEGLWLTQITFIGEQSTLEGRTLKPELVPRWMEGLKDEHSFRGDGFRMMEITPLPTSDTLPANEGKAETNAAKHPPAEGYRFTLSSKLESKPSDSTGEH